MDTAEQSPAERSAIRKIAIRLVPFLGLLFFINYLDRTAIAFGGPHGLTRDLGLSAAQFGFASGVFFVGYVLLEVPSNMALHRFGARRWIARIMVTWGIVSLLSTWVASAGQLYVLRLLLGVAEAGFFPGIVLFLSVWVPARHRSKILALFYLALPLTTVFGSPLAAALIGQDGAFGLAGWRFMFLCVSLPALVLGVVTWFYLPDRPADAHWLTPAERGWLIDAMAKEDPDPGHHQGFAHAFRNGRIWVLAVIYFGFQYGIAALAFFLPTIIAGFEGQFGTKLSVMQAGLVTAIPYLPAAVVLYLWSRDSARRGTRAWHIALPAFVGGVTIPLALFMGSPAAVLAVITVSTCAIFAALPTFWTVPTMFLSGRAAAVAIALINSIATIAGFASGYVTGLLKDLTGSYAPPMFVVGAVLLLSSALMIGLNRRATATADPTPGDVSRAGAISD